MMMKSLGMVWSGQCSLSTSPCDMSKDSCMKNKDKAIFYKGSWPFIFSLTESCFNASQMLKNHCTFCKITHLSFMHKKEAAA